MLFTLIAAGVLIAGCASLPAPKGEGSSLIVGEVTLDVRGTGQNTNGPDGLINANFISKTVVTLSGDKNGKPIQIETTSSTPDGMFTFPNLKPGQYRLVKLHQQFTTSNAIITIESSFGPEMIIDVPESTIVDLGVIRWSFSYDLRTGDSTNTATFQSSPNVMAAFKKSNAGSRWASYQTTLVLLSPKLDPDPSVDPRLRLIITQ